MWRQHWLGHNYISHWFQFVCISSILNVKRLIHLNVIVQFVPIVSKWRCIYCRASVCVASLKSGSYWISCFYSSYFCCLSLTDWINEQHQYKIKTFSIWPLPGLEEYVQKFIYTIQETNNHFRNNITHHKYWNCIVTYKCTQHKKNNLKLTMIKALTFWTDHTPRSIK